MHRPIAALCVAAAALGGPAAAEMRDVSGFHSVSAADRVTVEVIVGPAYSVEVTGSDAERIRTRLDGDTLRIGDARRPWFGTSPRLDAHIRVTTPALEGVAAARGAELAATLTGDCDAFRAAAAMGASAQVSGAQCDAVTAAASMGGEVRIVGACRRLAASASMGGYVRAEGLACATVDASASMGGEVSANAGEGYDASASMGGMIAMSGEGRSNGAATLMGGTITNR